MHIQILLISLNWQGAAGSRTGISREQAHLRTQQIARKVEPCLLQGTQFAHCCTKSMQGYFLDLRDKEEFMRKTWRRAYALPCSLSLTPTADILITSKVKGSKRFLGKKQPAFQKNIARHVMSEKQTLAIGLVKHFSAPLCVFPTAVVRCMPQIGSPAGMHRSHAVPTHLLDYMLPSQFRERFL